MQWMYRLRFLSDPVPCAVSCRWSIGHRFWPRENGLYRVGARGKALSMVSHPSPLPLWKFQRLFSFLCVLAMMYSFLLLSCLDSLYPLHPLHPLNVATTPASILRFPPLLHHNHLLLYHRSHHSRHSHHSLDDAPAHPCQNTPPPVHLPQHPGTAKVSCIRAA